VEEFEVHLDDLKGLGTAYKIAGYAKMEQHILRFTGIVFGGHYGGHNVSVRFTKAAKRILTNKMGLNKHGITDFEAEVQRRILEGKMIVHYERLSPDLPTDPFSLK
jgi:hypothetical protein